MDRAPSAPVSNRRRRRFLADPFDPGTFIEVGGSGGPAAGTPWVAADCRGLAPLSSVQSSPRKLSGFTLAHQGRYAKVTIPEDAPRARPGGVRQAIKGFSSRSRRALLNVVNSIDQERCKPGHFAFITLTYPAAFPSAAASKKDLDRLIKRFEREWGPRWLVWKLEPQQRGAPHFHLLAFMACEFDPEKLCEWFAHAWHDLAGGGDRHHLKWHLGQLGNRPCVERVRDWQGVANYAGKYLGKVSQGDEDWSHPGRYWGQRRADLAPIKLVTEYVPRAAAKLLRRACVRWLVRQPSPWLYCRGVSFLGKHFPGRRVHRSKAQDYPSHLLRPIKRRWKGRGGGCSIYMPAAKFKRLAEWAVGHYLETVDLAESEVW